MKSLFRSKKGFELSVNLIVTLIIAIVLFGSGLAFASKMFGGGNEMTDQVFQDFDNRVQELACSGTITYCLAEKSVTIEKGELKIVGLAVKNQLGDDTNFRVTLNHAETVLIESDGNQVTGGITPPLLLFDLEDTEGRTEPIANRDKHTFGIGIKVPDDAQSGKYTLTIHLKYQEINTDGTLKNTWKSYTDGKTIKLFVTV